MLRQTVLRRGAATSNIFAPAHTGRWFNPPHQWTWSDFGMPIFTFTLTPFWVACWIYNSAYGAQYSHYQEKNYYDALPYTKEFIHKYKRLERWRWY